MSKKVGNYCNLIVTIMGLLLAILVKTVAKPCGKMLITETGSQVHMRCFFSATTIMLFGIFLAIVALTAFVQKKTNSIVYIAAMIFLIVITNNSIGLGVCQAEGMTCGTMKIVNTIFAVVIGILGIVQLFVKGDKEL